MNESKALTWNTDDWLNEDPDEVAYEQMISDVTKCWFFPSEENSLQIGISRRKNIDKDRIAGHDRIFKDYFAESPIYTDDQFRQRFRIRREVFLRIETTVSSYDTYFQQKRDAIGVLGLSIKQKITTAIRMLAYNKATDEMDEYVHIGESTTLECLKRFCQAVVAVFKIEYLRAPTPTDLQRILEHSATQGFPGMMGSIDYMHWTWKNCPTAWAGQFQGRFGSTIIMLEAVATYDLWIWHAFFGMPGANNDLNVLDKSHIFRDQIQGVGATAQFCINGHLYSRCYMLAYGIYQRWPTFVQSIADPQGKKRKYFSKTQEAARKDVERYFGVLQARWAIVKNPVRLWSRDALHTIMTAIIILHNMIIEDECDDPMLNGLDLEGPSQDLYVERGMGHRDVRLPSMVLNMQAIRDAQSYHALRDDLIEHLWSLKGEQ